MQQSLLFDIVATAAPDQKSRTQKFYAEIKAEYWKMRNVKKNGVRLYSEEYILNTLSLKFHRAESTIEKIVNNWI